MRTVAAAQDTKEIIFDNEILVAGGGGHCWNALHSVWGTEVCELLRLTTAQIFDSKKMIDLMQFEVDFERFVAELTQLAVNGK